MSKSKIKRGESLRLGEEKVEYQERRKSKIKRGESRR